MLEIAVLGLLSQEPMHGYYIRKVLTEMTGGLFGISYGSLYPILNRLEEGGYIKSSEEDTPFIGRRKAKKVYEVTDAGTQHFQDLLADINKNAFNDEDFGIRLAFFDKTPPTARLQLLEGRRRLLEERRDRLMGSVEDPTAPLTEVALNTSPYSKGLHELTLDSTKREIAWVNKLIENEST
ncbi:MAG: PadR family transcriptional regulator [Lawsonella sp.]|nr:PadR family transcriptional regulator [Mycobacteriales bacterium]